jgi:hypothetical protein
MYGLANFKFTKFRIPNGMQNPAAATSADNGYGVECRQ